MKICLNWNTAGKGMALPAFVKLAKEAGFAGADVDMKWGVEHGAGTLRDLYGELGMAFGGWGVGFDWRGDKSLAAEGLAVLEKQAKIAAELGIDSCANHILPSSELPFHQNWHFHLMRLMPIAKVLGGHGLRFGLEFVSPYDLRRRWKHEFVFTPMGVLELAEEVGENCGLLVDSFHLAAAGEPMGAVARIPVKRIVMVHINDAAVEVVGGPLENWQDAKRMLPGEGGMDLKGFAAGLESIGYGGAVSLEVFSEELKGMGAEGAARRAGEAMGRWRAGMTR